MLINNLEDFLKSIPTAEGTQWIAIAPFVASADFEIQTSLVGPDLYTYISALADDRSLKISLQNLICYTGYYNAIPFVDLIQTPNGFGVVSSTSIAPASKERVERLLTWCEKMIDKTTDVLLQQILILPAALLEWKKFNQFNGLTNCLFLTGIDFAKWAKTENGSRADFLKVKSSLLAFQKNEMSDILSVNYVNELIDQNRNNSLTANNATVVEACKLAMGKYAEKAEHEAKELLIRIVVAMEKSLTDYHTYAASAEYALKMAPVYMNKKTDSTYFFG